MSCENVPAQQPQSEEQKQEEKSSEQPPADTKPDEAVPAGEADAPTVDKAPEEEVFAYRSLVLTGYGGYDKVKLQIKKGTLTPKSGEVVVRVKACGLNFADLLGRQGLYERLPAPPVTPGMECSGVIEAVGEEVTNRKAGDRVLVLSRCGLWQEVVVVPADHTFAMPEGMTFEEAAALPVNYATAYMMLFELGNVRSHQSVLVHMAAGGVGVAATQLCRTVEDVTVFGTASASKHEAIGGQGGVTHPIDYRTRDYVEEIRKISPKGLDLILDPLGGSDTHKAFALLKPMGTLIVYGAANRLTGQKKNLLALAKTWYNQFSINAQSLMHANKAVCGFHLGYLDGDFELVSRTMAKLLELYGEGKIKPRIDSTFHFEQVADAMRRMQERQNIGKVILLPEEAEPKTEDSEKEGKKEGAEKEELKVEEVKADEIVQDQVKTGEAAVEEVVAE